MVLSTISLRRLIGLSLIEHTPEAVACISQLLAQELAQPIPDRAPSGAATYREDEDEDDQVPASREPRVRGRTPIFEPGQRSIASLLSDIEQGIIALPDLQRQFVWEDTGARQLLDSLFLGFPVGTLVFWHTSNDPDAKLLGSDKPGLRANVLIIDGQQRLTSLYAVIKGVDVVGKDGVPRRMSIAFRPRDGRFEVADAAIRNDPEFLPNIAELWDGRRTPTQIRRDIVKRLQERGRAIDDQYEDAVDQNLSRAHAIINYRFPKVSNKTESVRELIRKTDKAYQSTKILEGVSALPRIADRACGRRTVAFYSITSPASASSVSGTVSPSAGIELGRLHDRQVGGLFAVIGSDDLQPDQGATFKLIAFTNGVSWATDKLWSQMEPVVELIRKT
ncbi:DUF262 domain-containing protein [Bradyrhizobium sp. ISRA442]|uniref:DUF262 domain-containing protein n=1 Tax=Bradyrhizobium sp. ISRA442 TaxID=2866197 RepID=UPI00311B0746